MLKACATGSFSIFEALAVGERRLLGEVIQLRGDELVAQVYEDTTGLEPGVTVVGLERPLSVTLGPNLLGGIFDGLLRPLSLATDYQIQPGAAERSVARHRLEFTCAGRRHIERRRSIRPDCLAATAVIAGAALGKRTRRSAGRTRGAS